jgi:hypothetical protein
MILVDTNIPKGKQAHDTRLVALMIEHRVPRILTFNDADFRRFTEIEPLKPFDVLANSQDLTRRHRRRS